MNETQAAAVQRLASAPPTTVTFEDVYRRELLPMTRLAFLLFGCQATAEEAVQEAFARVLERCDRIDNPGAYVRMAVVNRCRSARRRQARERAARGELCVAGSVGLDTDHLADALATLPAKRRAAIVLRYYGGHSEAGIATLLRVRPGTVKSLLHRGLRQLREVVER